MTHLLFFCFIIYFEAINILHKKCVFVGENFIHQHIDKLCFYTQARGERPTFRSRNKSTKSMSLILFHITPYIIITVIQALLGNLRGNHSLFTHKMYSTRSEICTRRIFVNKQKKLFRNSLFTLNFMQFNYFFTNIKNLLFIGLLILLYYFMYIIVCVKNE